jgi:hypothetical protein
MTYCIRVLAESDDRAQLDELCTLLGPEVELIVEGGDQREWSRVVLRGAGGEKIAVIQRESGEQVLDELKSTLRNATPNRAVAWLEHFFSHVKAIYTMKLESGAMAGDGLVAVLRAQAYLWKKFGGILQADGEGFTNREGRHILWQFQGPQAGELDAAVLNDEGRWVDFTLNMADEAQVGAFQRGEVPAGVMPGR